MRFEMKVYIHNADEVSFWNVASHLDATEKMDILCDDLHSGIITLIAEKHNCGAYGESVEDSDGNLLWQSAMSGCWQQGHQREERGDKKYAALFTNEAEFV